MAHRDWNARYAEGNLPWDIGLPDEHLVKWVQSGVIRPGRVLEVGCGTGTNALWLAQQGFDVLGIDLSPLAVDKARAKAKDTPHLRFEAHDFLAGQLAGRFDLVFDRGCFHVFDDATERDRFAARVAALLEPGGYWLSLIGSTEGPPRDTGPPRRSARDLAQAIEPHLELVELRDVVMEPREQASVRAWQCLSRRREMPAQPSSRY